MMRLPKGMRGATTMIRSWVAVVALSLALPSVARAQPVSEAQPTTDPSAIEALPEEADESEDKDEAPTGSASASTPDADGETSEPDAAEVPQPSPEQLEQQTRIVNARKHYDQGYVLYGQGRYAEAATEYELSYASVPAARALYSAALSYERAGKAVDAIRILQRYLELADCEALPPDDRDLTCATEHEEAAEVLEEQRRLVGELRLDLAEDTELREVRVAGRTVPLEDFPLMLRPGPVDVEMFGLQPEQRRTRVAYITAGEPFTLYVAPFVTEVTPPVVIGPNGPGDDNDRERARRRQQILGTSFWIGLGSTASSGIALAVVGGLTLRAKRTFERDKCAPMCSDPETGEPLGSAEQPLYPFEAREDFERLQPVTNALVGVTVGLGVATALVGAFAFRRRDREPSASAQVRVEGPGLVVRW